MNKYGYKVYYKNKRKLVCICITNSLASAKYHVVYNIKHSKDEVLSWKIIPIKTKREYKKLWKNCPF